MTNEQETNEQETIEQPSAPEPKPPSMATVKVCAHVARLNLTNKQAAAYLGVPLHTLRKWTTGERIPNSSALRLIDVMDTLQTLCPNVHDYFLKSESR